MNLEGEWKMMFWFFVGFLAKLVGKNGVWYAKCRQASLTDDVTGTMPPFDKCIVYGPAEPDKVAEKIKQRMAATAPSSLTSTTQAFGCPRPQQRPEPEGNRQDPHRQPLRQCIPEDADRRHQELRPVRQEPE